MQREQQIISFKTLPLYLATVYKAKSHRQPVGYILSRVLETINEKMYNGPFGYCTDRQDLVHNVYLYYRKLILKPYDPLQYIKVTLSANVAQLGTCTSIHTVKGSFACTHSMYRRTKIFFNNITYL